jgi:hypothetical protein
MGPSLVDTTDSPSRLCVSLRFPEINTDILLNFVTLIKRKFVKVVHPEEGYRLVGCTIIRTYPNHVKVPHHCLEWRGRSMTLPNNEGEVVQEENNED